MRLKYYLRGAGIGIIVTTLILSVAFSFSTNSVATPDVTNPVEAAKDSEEGAKEAAATDEGLADAEQAEQSEGLTSLESKDGDKTAEEEYNALVDKINNPDTSYKSTSKANKTDSTSSKANSSAESQSISYKAFTVAGGQSSNTIADNLYKAGIIDDAKKFSNYMDELGVDNRLQAGTFYVSDSMTYDDLVAILVTKQQDRDLTLPANAKVEEEN